jgi:ATPase family associated with various cellular activities (AAA)
MPRHFNTTGPCKPDIHYTLSPLVRLPNLEQLVEQQNYFVIHAPRQTGKTTAMLALAKQLTATGKYAAVMVSVEVGQPFTNDVGQAELAILASWRRAIRVRLPAPLHPPDWSISETGGRIQTALQEWAIASPLPLVVLIDEIDSLQDQALLSILRQLRDGFPDRPEAFPQSVGLIGLRDVRDYKIASGGSENLNTASPFNIKVQSLILRNFSPDEVAELYEQHTQATGQSFTAAAIDFAFELTQGQPWLVNALAKEVVEVILPDVTKEITIDHLQVAKENLIRRKDTHLDSLAERLRERRVRAILEPMMAGQELNETSSDDREFLVDLGLLRRENGSGLVIANPIYREILLRVLAQGPQDSLPSITPTWLTASGELDISALRDAFMAFWLQHGEPLLNSALYHEIAPHLVLMAFLHRVVNGGGTLEREYAIGSDRMDLCLRYGQVTLGIELKVQRDDGRNQLTSGLSQIEGYLTRLGLDSGWLVIFDRRKAALPIAQRLRSQLHQTDMGKTVEVIFA